MLGGIAQAEVNDQLKDLDEGSANKIPPNWKAFQPVGSFTSNNPVYQVYGQHQQKGNDQSSQKDRPKKNLNSGSSKQQSKYPLVGQLLNLNNKVKNAPPPNK